MMRRRGEVHIAPEAPVPDGRMIDPRTARFWASWQDSDAEGAVEDVGIVGADAAVAWGRARSDTVIIRLGHRGDTFFSAGDYHVADDDGPLPQWPPTKAPPAGWWVPATPTVSDVEAVAAAVRDGTMTKAEARQWAGQQRREMEWWNAPEALLVALVRMEEGYFGRGGA